MSAIFSMACADGPTVGPTAPEIAPARPLDYTNDAHWLCHPEAREDPCRSADLEATAMRSDGSTERVPDPGPAPSPAYDCFYLYPTVAFDREVGQVSAASLRERALDPVQAQVAHFRGRCRLFVPLYRQITLVTYVGVPDPRPHLERAYADVEAAFHHYLAREDPERPFVLLGHSQGTQMARRLVDRVIAPDPRLRRRLVAALLVGGDVLARRGERATTNAGGLPLCASTDEPGCIIAYRTYLRGDPPPAGRAPTVPGSIPAGEVPPCVHPASLTGGTDGRFASSRFPTGARQPAYDPWQQTEPPAETPFVRYDALYAGRCARDAAGFPYLAVHPSPGPNDARENPLPLDADVYAGGLLGLHLLDYPLALGDLLTAVDRLAASLRDRTQDTREKPPDGKPPGTEPGGLAN